MVMLKFEHHLKPLILCYFQNYLTFWKGLRDLERVAFKRRQEGAAFRYVRTRLLSHGDFDGPRQAIGRPTDCRTGGNDSCRDEAAIRFSCFANAAFSRPCSKPVVATQPMSPKWPFDSLALT